MDAWTTLNGKNSKRCAKKNHKVRVRMVAARMVRVLNMSVDETASILVHCPTWIRDWLHRYDKGDLEGLRIVAAPFRTHKGILRKSKTSRSCIFPSSSCLNAMEECRRQTLLVSEYCRIFSNMSQTV